MILSGTFLGVLAMLMLSALVDGSTDSKKDIESRDGIVVEKYSRKLDKYLFVYRAIDTVTIYATGDKPSISGTFVSFRPLQWLRYYDSLGKIHKCARYTLPEKNNGPQKQIVHLLGFRYPLFKNMRISFSVERINIGSAYFPPLFPSAVAKDLSMRIRTFPALCHSHVLLGKSENIDLFFSSLASKERKSVWHIQVFVGNILGVLLLWMQLYVIAK